jgi:alkylated DNA repair protein (DNA oxidative demethylase)
VFRLLPGFLAPDEQAALAAETLALAELAPPSRAITPYGRTMSVAMTSFGPLGWVSDARGYRYQPHHPVTGEPWPPIPQRLLDLWAELCPGHPPPDACLVNLYDAAARLGLHRDEDETDFSIPVLSVSLGDTALFRLGGLKRSDPTSRVRLASGDVCLLEGETRLAYHGVDRILPGSSRLLPNGGRLNLTLRRAAPPT